MVRILIVLTAGLALTVAAPAADKQEKTMQEKDGFDKAGNKTEAVLEKAGDGAEAGLDATGKGLGAAVEHGGRGAATAGKATAGALKTTGLAIADFFDGDDDSDRAERVKQAQRILQSKGYYGGPIDGIPGPQTRSGLREFQQDNNLEVSGRLNQKTAAQLGL